LTRPGRFDIVCPIDPKICHGQACIKGTRIAVHQIIRMLANGDKIQELLEDYLLPLMKK
jgi:uncharacterized protein (DUF433 family)